MRYVLHTVFLLIFSLIQPTWLEYVKILGVKPNLFLIYVIIFSCHSSKKEGMTVGFIFGLILDLFIGKALGLNAVLMLILSFIVADFCEKYIRKNTVFTTMVIIFTVTFLYELMYYIIAFLGDLNLLKAILRVAIPESVYCAVASIPLYYIIPKQDKSE